MSVTADWDAQQNGSAAEQQDGEERASSDQGGDQGARAPVTTAPPAGEQPAQEPPSQEPPAQEPPAQEPSAGDPAQPSVDPAQPGQDPAGQDPAQPSVDPAQPGQDPAGQDPPAAPSAPSGPSYPASADDSLVEAIQNAGDSGGGTVVLDAGQYGVIDLRGANPAARVTVVPGPGAVVDRIEVRGSSNVTFRDFVLRPDVQGEDVAAVLADETSSGLEFVNIEAYNGPDTANFGSWSQSEWLSRRASGMVIRSSDTLASGNTLVGFRFGVNATGAGAKVLNNLVDGFSADGMRGNGDNSVFSGNTVQNCVQVDGNHADGFQAWAPKDSGQALNNLTLKDNTITEWNAPTVSPLKCGLQGIGMFDGPYGDVTITGNTVETSVWHGISVFGVNGAVISGNHIEQVAGADKVPWIGVFPNKNGSQSANVQIYDNTAPRYRFGSGVTAQSGNEGTQGPPMWEGAE